jgi:hypothetical protein
MAYNRCGNRNSFVIKFSQSFWGITHMSFLLVMNNVMYETR